MGQPRYGISRDGAITVSHREYVGDVISHDTPFEVASYPINPGLATFPWLSSIAANYESYVFRKLEFEYESMAASTIGGEIMMAVDFDALDGAPGNKADMSSFKTFVRTNPWLSARLVCPKVDLTKAFKERYTRDASTVVGDLKTYDVGLFSVATNGIAAEGTYGSVYVNYVVEFRTPQRSTQQLDTQTFAIDSTADPAINYTTLFGSTLPIVRANNTITDSKVSVGLIGQLSEINATTFAGNYINFYSLGKYLIDVDFGASLVGTTWAAAYGTGVTLVRDLMSGGSFSWNRLNVNYWSAGKFIVNVTKPGFMHFTTNALGTYRGVNLIATKLVPEASEALGFVA